MSVSSSTTSTRGRPDMSPMVGSARARDRGGWRRPGGCGPSPSKWPGMATRRRKRRRPRGPWPPLDLPQLEQRHWDVIGLALVGFAAFFACVFYLDWSGGQVGEAMADGFLFLFGGLGYLTPVALFAAGALLVVRPMMERVHPFRTGAACLAGALLLGLAAGSLGLGPGDTPRDGFLDADYLRRHGGLSGEVLFWSSSTLFSEAGSHILFVFLLLAGLLLVTGASIAGLMSATRDAATSTTERMRGATRSLHAAATAPLPPRGPLPGDPMPGVPDPVEPPEPPNTEPVVRATHVEAPALDAAERYPDLYGEDEFGAERTDESAGEPEPGELPELPPGEDEPGEEPLQEELAPMGNRRS